MKRLLAVAATLILALRRPRPGANQVGHADGLSGE